MRDPTYLARYFTGDAAGRIAASGEGSTIVNLQPDHASLNVLDDHYASHS